MPQLVTHWRERLKRCSEDRTGALQLPPRREMRRAALASLWGE